MIEKVWVEKYRPVNIADTILPERLKILFNKLVSEKNIPNMLFIGSAGTGKTTIAKALANELKADYLLINASEERGIDVLRSKVKDFCVTMSSVTRVPKLIILDEADNMASGTLLALRGFIEQYSSNARFIFTANYKNKFPEPIQSRLQCIDFSWTKDERNQLMKDFFKRLLNILETEKAQVTPDGKKSLAEFIKCLFPDMRKIINEIQKYILSYAEIDIGILSLVDDSKYLEFYKYLKEKSFTKCREWIALNVGEDVESFYMKLYTDLEKVFVNESIPEVILHINDAQNSFGFSKEIICVTLMIKILTTCDFK